MSPRMTFPSTFGQYNNLSTDYRYFPSQLEGDGYTNDRRSEAVDSRYSNYEHQPTVTPLPLSTLSFSSTPTGTQYHRTPSPPYPSILEHHIEPTNPSRHLGIVDQSISQGYHSLPSDHSLASALGPGYADPRMHFPNPPNAPVDLQQFSWTGSNWHAPTNPTEFLNDWDLQSELPSLLSNFPAANNPIPTASELLDLPTCSKFIPQRLYKCPGRRSEVQFDEPIRFNVRDSIGIPIRDALEKRYSGLHRRDDPVFTGHGPSVSIRLEVPGYQPWSRQIKTMDWCKPPQHITLAKLATETAKSVERFIQAIQEKDIDPEYAEWRFGSGYIDIDRLSLVALNQVSKSSWQPDLMLIVS